MKKLLVISFISLLVSCTTMKKFPYKPYIYQTERNDITYYHSNTEAEVNQNNEYRYGRQVSVPESYHVGPYHSPTLHKDRDRSWVNSQNPTGYTIQIADDESASTVANRLFQAPKNERMAEIQYQSQGRTYYRGVYGSYKTKEEALEALNSLPETLKQRASVQEWSSVQGRL